MYHTAYVTIMVSLHALLTYITIIYGKRYIFRPFEFDIQNNEECRMAFLAAIGTFIIWISSGVF